MISRVNYLGHKISQERIKPIPEKVDGIINAPFPTNMSQLRFFFFFLNFLLNTLNVLKSLHRLLDNDVKWS